MQVRKNTRVQLSLIRLIILRTIAKQNRRLNVVDARGRQCCIDAESQTLTLFTGGADPGMGGLGSCPAYINQNLGVVMTAKSTLSRTRGQTIT